ncbi:hypothetical protein IGI04_015123 [Brassica rapa subsp. trilocularis]|uniref:Uncharacterized protein n=1 Tax=Brassica rapa subsp. trilocularis TaxID=1813537 RepID=A0ABQ7MP56_BRACM|nr:hypothetical protein IGI04_015123 [Brassica rapa subsp. trilocularis]
MSQPKAMVFSSSQSCRSHQLRLQSNFIAVKNLCLDLASFSCYVCCLHSQYVCYGSTTSTPLFAREIMTLFPSGTNSLGEALILFFQSKQFIDSLDKSLKPYQRVKIETLRCRFVFLITTKFLDILLQHGYKIWKEMYGEDLDDSNVALYSEWK